jgi:hypothetical protein
VEDELRVLKQLVLAQVRRITALEARLDHLTARKLEEQ